MAKGGDQLKNVRLTSACKNGFLQPCQIFHKCGDTGKVSSRNYIMNAASPADKFSITELLRLTASDLTLISSHTSCLTALLDNVFYSPVLNNITIQCLPFLSKKLLLCVVKIT